MLVQCQTQYHKEIFLCGQSQGSTNLLFDNQSSEYSAAEINSIFKNIKDIIMNNSIISLAESDGAEQGEVVVVEPNTGKQEKKRRTCRDYRKYEESYVRIKCISISKKKKSNYSSFQDLRSSYNRDMVKYKGPRPTTTQARALNEKSNKKIPPATSQPPGWRVCCPTEGVLPGRRLCRPALGAHIFHFTQEETRKAKKEEGSL
ncbi:hypothetical protein Tco_0567727 [Tanacetum coccineum]